MKIKFPTGGVAVALIWAATACTTIKNASDAPFSLQDAFYYSWVADEKEKGTNIFLEVNKLDANIHFDSIIFRGVRLPLFSESKGDALLLNAILPSGFSRIRIDPVPDRRSDQLIFTVDGRKQSFALKKIRRGKMKYY